jgi:hypothetical protein
MARLRLQIMRHRTIGRAIASMMNGVITDMENGATVATFIGQAAIELGTGVSPDGLCKTVYANRTEVISPPVI